jgi:hypothetical protein
MPVRRTIVSIRSIGLRAAGASSYHVHRATASGRYGPLNPYRIYRVRPSAVSRVMRERLPEQLRGSSVAGSWDLAAIDVCQTAVYRGLHQHFVEGLDWLDTELSPERYRAEFDNAPRRYLSYSLDEFLKRGEYLDELAETLSSRGYLTHMRLCRPFRSEMAVNVGRDGTLIRNSSGLHRLALSQLLGLDSIAVRVLVTHSACVLERIGLSADLGTVG